MMEKLKYFIKEGFRNIWVNGMMSLASVGILAICILLLGTSLLLSVNMNRLISQLESSNQIMVYLKSDVKPADIPKTGDQIKAMSNVTKCTYLTRDEIYKQAKKELGQQNVLMTGIDSSAFDNAYQVKVNNMTHYTETASKISSLPGVKYVRQDAGLATTLIHVKKVIGIVGIWLFVIMAVTSLFIIANTIKLAMFGRKREINIMKFVGATDWFIRWPFIVEGFIIGIIAGALALIAQLYIYRGLVAQFTSMLPVMHMVDINSVFAFMCLSFLLCGVLVGSLGSYISVRRYLKV